MTNAEIQSALMALGYDVGPRGADGDLGGAKSDTRKAVRQFQKDYRLAVDGKPGPVTQEALRLALAGKAAPAPKKAATRRVDTLVVHCTASPEGTDLTVKQIDAMHRAQGWAQIGYHYVIRLDGTVEPGRPESIVGAHVAGHNTGSIGISYVGGLERKTLKPKDTRTPAQKAAIERLLADLGSRYPITRILGHRDFSPDKDGDGLIEPNEWIKVCPCYDAGPEHAHLLRKRAA